MRSSENDLALPHYREAGRRPNGCKYTRPKTHAFTAPSLSSSCWRTSVARGKNTFLRLNNIVPHRKANQVAYRTQLQFHHHSRAVCLGGPDADVHFAGNVFVAFTIR